MNAKQFKEIYPKRRETTGQIPDWEFMEAYGQYKAAKMFLDIYPTEKRYQSALSVIEIYMPVDEVTRHSWYNHKAIVDKWEK